MRSSFESLPLPVEIGSAFVPLGGRRDGGLDPEAELAGEVGSPGPSGSAEPPVVVEERLVPDPEPLRQTVAALERALVELREQQREERSRWLWGALDVAFALARRVLERESSVDPRSLHVLIGRAVELVADSGPVEVALSNEDAVLLADSVPAALTQLRERVEIEFVSDPRVAVGEARVTSGASSVDLRLERVLALLREEVVPEWTRIQADEEGAA